MHDKEPHLSHECIIKVTLGSFEWTLGRLRADQGLARGVSFEPCMVFQDSALRQSSGELSTGGCAQLQKL